jgi:uncharacterized membrane protein (UPF0127 family)
MALRAPVPAHVAGALLVVASLANLAYAQSDAQPTLKKAALRAGMHLIRAEIADSHETRMAGLMHRQSLDLNSGMLFVFDHKDKHCFWMKNTPLPLSIAFIKRDGTIVTIKDMAPNSEQTTCPSEPVSYALEMKQGWFKAKGVKVGSVLVAKDIFGPKQ